MASNHAKQMDIDHNHDLNLYLSLHEGRTVAPVKWIDTYLTHV